MTRPVKTPTADLDDAVHVELSRDGSVLIVRLRETHALLSWALVNGGRTEGRAVVWRYVDEREFGDGSDAEGMLRRGLASVSLPDAVGLLTARALDTYSDRRRTFGDLGARCIATVGLSNALRAGDEPAGVPEAAGAAGGGEVGRPGTINLLCRVSAPLTDEALIEALSLAAEARTAAVLESRIRSARNGLAATGTGTDCIVMAAPLAGDVIRFAGKHTAVGHLVGAVVAEAVRDGIERWKRECP